ncbi:hypothetical protein MKX03_002680 [Papaver bracteatum]|nr:hypothetical protein MKX03_002680 [Papaver bracteatum]
MFPRKEWQVIMFVSVEKAGFRLQLHVQVYCKEVNMKMHVHASTDSGERLLKLKGSSDVERSLLKLFRNLWFYIALFGLTPPIQKNQFPTKSITTTLNAQCLRGSGNETAAVTQIAALSSALGGRVEVAALSSITGVKEIYLLACLSAIVHRAFETTVSCLEERVSKTGNEAEIMEATLSAHTCFLIKSMWQREQHLRDISVSLLSQLKDRFPQKVVREWITNSLSYAPCTSQDNTQYNADVVSLLSEIRIGTGKNDGWMALIFEVLLSTGFNEMLLKKSVVQLQKFVNTRGEAVDKLLFREACSGGTALSNLEGFSQILRLLCWCPAYISTPNAMETGIFIWTWYLVLAELVDAWLWTVDMKRRLFAPHLAPAKPKMLPAKDPVEEIIAHRLWLGFFIDRFEVVHRMLQGTIKFPSQFPRHPVVTGTFFTVMLLGLKFCSCQWKCNLQNSRSGLQLLEDRICQAALGWFANNFALSEAQSISLFVHHLSNERVEALPSDSSSKGLVRESGSCHGDMDQ